MSGNKRFNKPKGLILGALLVITALLTGTPALIASGVEITIEAISE